MNYQTIEETVCALNTAGHDEEIEVELRFTPLGLTQFGTFILDGEPTEEEEEVIYRYQADWALECRFIDFNSQVKDWEKLRQFLSTMKLYIEEELEAAQEFLRGEDWDGSVIYAQELQFFKTYDNWKQQQFLNSAVPVTNTPAKPLNKI